jgi:hypothetical protein
MTPLAPRTPSRSAGSRRTRCWPGTALGFGFQSLMLDLSGTEALLDLLSRFGVGDDIRGLCLPDVRVLVLQRQL